MPRQSMLQMPSAPRSIFSEQPEGLRISIYLPVRRDIVIFIPLWLVGWSWALREEYPKVMSNPFGDPFTTIWFLAWIVFGPLFAFGWFWNLFGRVDLTIRADTFALRQSIFGLARNRQFSTAELFNLEFVPQQGSGKRRRASHLRFHYGPDVVKFADEIEIREGDLIIKRIAERALIRRLPVYAEL